MLKVTKFGGSSMADAGQYRKVRDIIVADPDRRVVIVSAAGKRDSSDHKITDLLYLCHAHTQYGVACDPVYEMITSRYLQIRDDLGLDLDLESDFAELKKRLDKKAVSQDVAIQMISSGMCGAFDKKLVECLIRYIDEHNGKFSEKRIPVHDRQPKKGRLAMKINSIQFRFLITIIAAILAVSLVIGGLSISKVDHFIQEQAEDSAGVNLISLK